MPSQVQNHKAGARGFSFLEVVLVVGLMSILMWAVLSQMTLINQAARSEQVKVDIFQESREFADQLVRDLHQAGYPSIHMFDTSSVSWSPAFSSPLYSDSRLATGLIKISPSEVQFEGDVDGDGYVHIVDYVLQSSGNNCPCLQRSDVLKSSGIAVLSNDIQNVENAGTTADPIFVGYTATGTLISSADETTAAGLNNLASIQTVQYFIKVKAATLDPRTGQAAETTLSGQVKINNCSLAASGQANSC